jgi:hypothetical protein
LKKVKNRFVYEHISGKYGGDCEVQKFPVQEAVWEYRIG